MDTVEITVRTRELLQKQAGKLRGRVTDYWGGARTGEKQEWTVGDAICITNLLSIYGTIEDFGTNSFKVSDKKYGSIVESVGDHVYSRDKNVYDKQDKKKRRKTFIRPKPKQRKVFNRKG